MNNTASSILSIENADFGYFTKNGKSNILSDINLVVKKSELICLIGRNGSGKSTLLRTLVRLQETLKGNILLEGKNINGIRRFDLAKLLSSVSTGVVENDSMTIRELVSLGRFPYTNWIGSLSEEDHEIIDHSLNMAGISALAGRKINEVSDGERQRAMIARTLAQNTPLVILDEPTAFMDIPAKYDLINLLYELTRKGKAIIYSTHDLNIAIKFSDKIWIIDKNRVFEGSPEDLVLNNTISEIFESDKIIFKPESGDFELKTNARAVIRLEGNDPVSTLWTRQALGRKGYGISKDEMLEDKIEVKKEKGEIVWILHTEKQNLYYRSISELLSGLEITFNTKEHDTV